MMKSITSFIFCALAFATSAAADTKPSNVCKPLSFDQLKKETLGNGETKLVFFASWCSSCAEKMKASDQQGTIFVATFDSAERAQEVIDVMKIEQKCVIDDGIANALSVHALPAERVVKF